MHLQRLARGGGEPRLTATGRRQLGTRGAGLQHRSLRRPGLAPDGGMRLRRGLPAAGDGPGEEEQQQEDLRPSHGDLLAGSRRREHLLST
ncbi:MAG: hypothetical protein FJ098_03895 [Deltaproteobacteria bacterium]|nr:hypothetical protein [Deltaproteobacteria bacterium]